MAAQSIAGLHLLTGLFPTQFCFLTSLPIFLILHLLISVCTQFHHLFFGRPLSRLTWRLFLYTWLTFLLLSILLTWPIQFNRLIWTNESVSKSRLLASFYVFLSVSCCVLRIDLGKEEHICGAKGLHECAVSCVDPRRRYVTPNWMPFNKESETNFERSALIEVDKFN
jgi:hypothetical protein